MLTSCNIKTGHVYIPKDWVTRTNLTNNQKSIYPSSPNRYPNMPDIAPVHTLYSDLRKYSPRGVQTKPYPLTDRHPVELDTYANFSFPQPDISTHMKPEYLKDAQGVRTIPYFKR